MAKRPRVVVVGPDAAGKSTLVDRLNDAGYNARCCAQEHSQVPDMWRRISNPDFLVFLDVKLETIARRRAIDWGQKRFDAQQTLLAHARSHCDLYVQTDDLTPSGVAERVRMGLSAAGIGPISLSDQDISATID